MMAEEQEAAAYMGRAYESLRIATELYAAGHYGVSASRAYYAVFYAATAVLLCRGLTASKHSAVIALVNQHLVKPGEIDKESGKLFEWLFELRSTADYDVMRPITHEQAEKAIAIAQRMVSDLSALVQ